MAYHDNINDYFSTFKIGKLGKGQSGNLEEFTLDELKQGGNFVSEIFYADGTDAFANMGFVVSFMHVPSEEYVHFKAFINSFNETFSSDWDTQSVYGRTDPIRMFKQTSRRITLSLIVPASSQAEGFENLSRVQKLTSYLYPTYESVDNALTISQSPLIRMRVMNMVTNTSGEPSDGTFEKMQGRMDVLNRRGESTGKTQVIPRKNLDKGSVQKGLLGAIANISVNHNIDNPDMGSFHVSPGVIIPKAIEVTLDFDVIHEKTLGWIEGAGGSQNFSDKLFPYGVNFEGSAPRTLAQLEEEQYAAQAGITSERIAQIEADNERAHSEQMLQNAIAAGHVVADGIVNGKTQFKLSKKGQRAADRLRKRGKKEIGSRDFNPFDGNNTRSFPDQATADAAAAYAGFLNPQNEDGTDATPTNFNDFL